MKWVQHVQRRAKWSLERQGSLKVDSHVGTRGTSMLGPGPIVFLESATTWLPGYRDITLALNFSLVGSQWLP